MKIRGAIAMRLMVKGYKSGTIVFGLITGEKVMSKAAALRSSIGLPPVEGI